MSGDAAPCHVTDRRLQHQFQTVKLMLHLLARFMCMQTQLETILHLIPAQTFKLDTSNRSCRKLPSEQRNQGQNCKARISLHGVLWSTARQMQSDSCGRSSSSGQGSGIGTGSSSSSTGSSSSSIVSGVRHAHDGHCLLARHEFRYMACPD